MDISSLLTKMEVFIILLPFQLLVIQDKPFLQYFDGI
jgi:hypothetical protein